MTKYPKFPKTPPSTTIPKDEEYRVEVIRCPKCGRVQEAEVLHTTPWDSYVHDCIKCGYTIMESEWEIA